MASNQATPQRSSGPYQNLSPLSCRRVSPWDFANSVSCLREPFFQKLADGMADRDVHLLNPRRRLGGNAQTQVACCSHLPPRFTREPDDGGFTLTSRLNCAQDIPAIAACGDRQKHVARPGMGG